MGSSRGRQTLVHKQHGPSRSRGKGGSTNPPLIATHYLRPILVFGAGRRIAHCLVHSSIPRAACGSGECSAPLEQGVPGVACPTASASTLGHTPPGHLQLALALCPSCARPAPPYSLPPFPPGTTTRAGTTNGQLLRLRHSAVPRGPASTHKAGAQVAARHSERLPALRAAGPGFPGHRPSVARQPGVHPGRRNGALQQGAHTLRWGRALRSSNKKPASLAG